ncbi:MAG: decaprenylphosphoryl-beta-D-ribose oxidase, partial [Nocardioidaceae bacterium]|nr:decaprenylphosphoryl-beta-D-ribose oxidase [Nocardioidaceae bacterium]
MTERFVGWGRTAPSFATRVVPRDMDELVSTVAAATPQRGILVRGLGRSYGDAAQNAGGTILDLTGWTRVIALDTSAATISVESGASIDQIMRLLLPHGLWLPVIPGTRQVTVGGAISADVHGKNHHARGSFGHHVLEIDLLTAQGELLTLRPEGTTAELFWATVGGMGLTGVITRATLSLTHVESSFFAVDTQRVPHIRELVEILSGGDDAYEYSVAWFDTATSGNSLGRAVLTRGRSARVDELPERLRDTALDLADEHQLALPGVLPRGLVNRLSARAFNALWFAKAPTRRDGEIQSVRQFFHPLDAVRDWNHVYGPRGFVQYQFVVPF